MLNTHTGREREKKREAWAFNVSPQEGRDETQLVSSCGATKLIAVRKCLEGLPTPQNTELL